MSDSMEMVAKDLETLSIEEIRGIHESAVIKGREALELVRSCNELLQRVERVKKLAVGAIEAKILSKPAAPTPPEDKL